MHLPSSAGSAHERPPTYVFTAHADESTARLPLMGGDCPCEAEFKHDGGRLTAPATRGSATPSRMLGSTWRGVASARMSVVLANGGPATIVLDANATKTATADPPLLS